jgi:hypothetical protein
MGVSFLFAFAHFAHNGNNNLKSKNWVILFILTYHQSWKEEQAGIDQQAVLLGPKIYEILQFQMLLLLYKAPSISDLSAFSNHNEVTQELLSQVFRLDRQLKSW